MRFFVKAIATGFAMSMGSALFKRVSDKMGLENEASKDEATAQKAEAAEAAEEAANGEEDESQ
ncbi:MAG: hypothetical protein GY811_01320 [Myxococcales bacterium]|nr:hypothetical protein [Myxococcales bacterium]